MATGTVKWFNEIIRRPEIHGLNSSCNLIIGADDDAFRIREFVVNGRRDDIILNGFQG